MDGRSCLPLGKILGRLGDRCEEDEDGAFLCVTDQGRDDRRGAHQEVEANGPMEDEVQERPAAEIEGAGKDRRDSAGLDQAGRSASRADQPAQQQERRRGRRRDQLGTAPVMVRTGNCRGSARGSLMVRGPGNLDRIVTRWFQDGDHRLGITHDSSSHRDLA